MNVADNAALTVKEHATLTGDILMGKNAVLNLWDRATLAGKLVLKEADSFLRADITDRTSIMGATASLLSADVSGAGKVVKTGDGMLTVSGNVSNEQGIEVSEGQLQVTGNITAPVNMGKSTLLSGDGYISNLNLNDTAAIAPGAVSVESGLWSALRVGTLNASEPVSLRINSGFAKNATDRLLIDGDLNTPEGKPLELSVNAVQIWQDSDTNKNGAADNREGVSLVQVGGKSRADSVRLAGRYVARGAWAYGLYAFAPGHASTDERLVKGEGDRYWDYRLQNIMLDADGISTPVDLTPAPEPAPSPEPTPQPEPTPSPEPAPKPIHKAVIPQVPAYISLPAMALNFDRNMATLLTDTAQESRSYFFINGYSGRDDYHSSGEFSNYGYDFKSQYQGWFMGARWQSDSEKSSRFALSTGIHKGNLSLSPRSVEGESHAGFKTRGIVSQLSWQHDNGMVLDITTGYTRFNGNVVTDLRGKTADPQAAIWHVGMEGGKAWDFGTHRITPLAGIDYQHLRINSFTDVDNARVRYRMHNAPAYSAALQHNWQALPGLTLNHEARIRLAPGKAAVTQISGGGDEALFRSGKGGDSLQLKSGVSLRVSDNVSLHTQARYQQRLQREGVSDWNIAGGVKVDF
ncbi:autotransporter domain-containing protein (plasmid) [Winslowiella toletana]|uniref:autotransporter domain-containing protein n=1 Tax=Winslowiella toletana TaxID=92490 RepID=UPI0028BE7E7F|nr:autotransporter domain-containing protein [Winslowiella toletana]WNN46705.1 autotransporter domain-containing protein [Winslowiella toletana]